MHNTGEVNKIIVVVRETHLSLYQLGMVVCGCAELLAAHGGSTVPTGQCACRNRSLDHSCIIVYRDLLDEQGGLI